MPKGFKIKLDSNIILISSVEGYDLSHFPIPFYAITKTAILSLTKVL